MNDYELLQRYATQGDESAFAAIVERYLGKLYGVAFRRTGDRLLAEEIVQDVFTALAKKASSMDTKTVLACWLHRAATLRSLHVMRSESRRKRKMTTYSEDEPNAEAAEPVLDRDLIAILDQAIDELDAQDRKLVLLRFFDDLSIREIASRMGMSKSAAQRHADRALEKLSSLLKRRDVVLPVTALAAVMTSEFAKAAPTSLTTAAVTQGALKAALVSSATFAAKLTTLLTMTKTPILIAVGGLLVFFSTKGGVQLGQSQALANREALLERAVLAESLPVASIDQPQVTPAETTPPLGDPLGRIIAKVLKLATDEGTDPQSDELQALLSQIDQSRMPEAMGYLDKQTNTRDRKILGGMLLMRWAQLDGVAAGEAALEIGEGSSVGWYTAIVASTWSQSDPRAALSWQQSLADEVDNEPKRQMLREIFKQWADKDREEALEALSELSYDEQKAGVWGFSNHGSETQRILKEIGGTE